MPHSSAWAPPKKFLDHGGVAVYHTYRNNDINQGRRLYWYTLDELCDEDDCQDDGACAAAGHCVMVFDVRDLPAWREMSPPPGPPADTDSGVRRALIQSIDRGQLTADGVKQTGK